MRAPASSDVARVWTAADLGELRLLRATYQRYAFGRHLHETYVVAVTESGAEEFACRGKTWIAPPGSLVLLEPGEPHTGHAHGGEPWTYRCFYAPASLLNGLSRQGRSVRFPRAVVHDPELARELVALHRLLEHSPETCERQERLVETMTKVIGRHAPSDAEHTRVGSEPDAVRKARLLIEERYAQNLALADLGAAAGLSSHHLVRAFRRSVGVPPHEYLTQVRVWHAMRLLAAGMPAADVALDTGFVDQSHLTRRFKPLVGITPAQFARGHRSAARTSYKKALAARR